MLSVLNISECLSFFMLRKPPEIGYPHLISTKQDKMRMKVTRPMISSVDWISSSSSRLYLSCSLADHWGTTVDFTTSFLHSSRFSAFHSMIFHSRPVHSLMLSSHCFLCLPLRLPPWTVPCCGAGFAFSSPVTFKSRSRSLRLVTKCTVL